MTTPAHIPDAVHSLADLAATEAAARRAETPCGDATMVWHRWGDAAAPAVALLHGGAGSWNHWARNIAPLVAAGHQVLAPDLPGFGDSARPPTGQDADALPPWVEAGLAGLLGNAPCDLVAFSFGGMVAGFMAAAYPARVRRLVLAGAPALTPEGRPELDLRRWAHLAPGPERDDALRYNLRSLMLARDESVDELSLGIHAANLARDRMKLRRLSRTDVLLRTLPQVRCPVYGIWGERDILTLGRTEVIAPALAQAPDFRSLTLVPGAGHWVQFEAAEAFNSALLRALSEPLLRPG